MLVKSDSKNNSKSGQAMIELIPAILLFFIVIIASMVFFIGLRESFHMQIAARNAMFAKIRNSGPLISPPSSAALASKNYNFGLGVTTNPNVNQEASCFTARPQTSQTQVILPTILGQTLNLERAHRATIFRRPAAANACDNIP